jgi:hypothetical protein
VSLQAWKEVKVIPLPKNSKAPFAASNRHPISLLPVLSKQMERIEFEQIQCYFLKITLNTDFQHVYGEGYSTWLGWLMIG